MKFINRATLLIAIVLLQFSSCSRSSNTPTGLSEPQRIIGVENLDHFPKYLKYKWITGGYRIPSEFYPEDNAGAYYQQVYKLRNKRQGIELGEHLLKNSQFVVQHSDDCTIWIYRGGADPPAQAIARCDNVIPVPAFWEQMMHYGVNDLKELPNDFTIYVLKVEQGKYLKDEALFSNSYMPEDWVHGISKGVAYSKNRGEAIFWVDIW